MTKTKIDYSKGLIYKFVCNDLECKDIYVGSTTNFIQRKYLHKSACNNENSKSYNLKIYKTIRDNGGWYNWSMIEIEKYPCNDGNELRARERVKYEELKANMNSNVPNRSPKEYDEYNKERIKEYQKEYQKDNKEQLKEYKKEYNKKYRENNKKKISENNKIKISCICGSTFRKSDKGKHEQTKKHINYVNSQLD